MRNILTGYSRALYSNWLWHRPLRLVVDAGEGIHLALGKDVFAPDVVAITHGHSDHVLGLAGFAGARRFGKGAPTKPWTVLYPAESPGIAATRDLIARLWRGVEFPVEWIAVRHGETYRLSQHRAIEAFAVTHVPPEPAVGYRVLETRRRLKSTHAALSTDEVEALARSKGRDELMDTYTHVLFAHSGDAMPIDVSLVSSADLLVHDATFLAAADRREPIHASVEEVLRVAKEARVGTLVMNHLSVRYPREEALTAIRERLDASGFDGDCWLLDESEFINLRT